MPRPLMYLAVVAVPDEPGFYAIYIARDQASVRMTAPDVEENIRHTARQVATLLKVPVEWCEGSDNWAWLDHRLNPDPSVGWSPGLVPRPAAAD